MSEKLKSLLTSKTGKLIIFNFALALFIILWGAWVRLSGSGAGCGDHWPLCHGEVIPLTPSIKTLIEFTHRLTSGVFGITVFAQVIFAAKEFGRKHAQFKASVVFLILTIVEALIGAVLVKKGLVVDNSSAMRAWVIGAHLVNTLLLMGSLTFCGFFHQKDVKWSGAQIPNWEKLSSIVGLILILIVGAFGAVTALGNSLFPSESLAQGFASDFDPNAPFLIRLRIYHPALAILTGIVWIVLLTKWKEIEESAGSAQVSFTLVFIAIAFGGLNWFLMAPTWGALTHLLLADLLWVALVWSTASRLLKVST